MKPSYLKGQFIHRMFRQLDADFKVMDDNFNPVLSATMLRS